mmetsp:Transcript_74467/g.139066  ORF Transcript_74467/g.139066 Transcript_74467/m.139066 type:complete len:337 (-) Transcript_74467:154-1164(-)
MAKFQVQLAGEWKDYSKNEDRILKRSFMAGYPNCRFSLRGASYEYNFDRMVQKNLTTGKERKIRAPYRWRQPAKPIVPKGPTLCMIVPAGSPGKVIMIDHPRVKGAKMQVAVPKYAKVGQAMLVPIPDVAVASKVSVITAGVVSVAIAKSKSDCSSQAEESPSSGSPSEASSLGTANNAVPCAAPATGNGKPVKSGWSTCAKVAAGGAAVAALGGAAFVAAVAATEARDDDPSGEPLPAAPADDGWSPPADDGMASCPEAADALGGVEEGAAEGAAEEDGATMCDDVAGEDGGVADADGIIDGDDDGEWIAEMCGFDDGLGGDGADAAADFVVDLF